MTLIDGYDGCLDRFCRVLDTEDVGWHERLINVSTKLGCGAFDWASARSWFSLSAAIRTVDRCVRCPSSA
jgi:hypothetical protein